MNPSMLRIALILKRELMELRSWRTLLALGLLGALQFFVSLVSKAHGRVEDTILVFQMGGIIAIILGFDLVAKEREQHTIDLLLTQGISRQGLFAAKWLAMLIFCLLGGLVFGLGNGLGMLLRTIPLNGLDLWVESGMVAWLFCVYGSIALLLSVLFRRAKMALAGSILIWMFFRPAVMALLVFNPLKELLGWTKSQLWQGLAVMPEFAFHIGVEPLRGIPDGVSLQPAWCYVALAGYLVVLSTVAWGVFIRQDETF
jgi:ABC-type transport system involved in multi-copper enzyme maturation permease subunit